MRVVVSYDVNVTDAAGKSRWRKICRVCKSYGTRVQFSVFDCSVEAKEWVKLRHRLLSVVDLKLDSLRFYHLNDGALVEHHGVREPVNLDGPLIV